MESKIYKTPAYVRKAASNYYNRNKEDPEFMDKLRKQKKQYYENNKQDPDKLKKQRARNAEYMRKYRAARKNTDTKN